MTHLALTMALLMAAPTTEARRSGDGGTPVTIRVLDAVGEPIAAAVVRNPVEAARHRVNAITGEWTTPVLYLPDGGEMTFTPGMSVRFEVSAPGYMPQIIQYDVRKRRNKVEITLNEMRLDDDIKEPIIPFDRDDPRQPSMTSPAS